MALDPQLAAQLRQILSYQLSSGTANNFGEVQAGSTSTIYCRLENKTRAVERMDGTYEVSRPYPFLVIDAVSGFTPTMGMRLWLPGTSPNTASVARKPISIEPYHDENGVLEHWEMSI